MRVFLTGATGFVGSAIVQELKAAGHDVLGLARTDAAADTLAGWGVEAHRGDLSDPAGLAAAARACDGVIHTAFIHDFTRYLANAETDRVALAAMADALEGTGKPLVSTSATGVLAEGRLGVETDGPDASGHGRLRAVSEQVLSAADRGVRVSVIRLAPTVHDRGDHGFVPALIDVARRKGAAAYIGEGANRWPAVHRLDAARLYRLALEKAEPGARLHGVAEQAIPMRDIAQTIGEGLGLPVRSITPEQAPAWFEWIAGFAAMDIPTSSAITQATLGWRPEWAGLIADLRDGGYFE